jgi:Cu-Zn family superoxide dismutase
MNLKRLGIVPVLALAAPLYAAPPTKAVAVIRGAAGDSIEGTVTFSQAAGGTRVQAHVSGLTPGTHGFHVHEYGDCSAKDFASAGGHFNPAGDPHADPKAEKRHAGDMGNIEASKAGVGELDYVDPKLKFDGADSVLGRGVIVHANADDLKTQPTGNAGGRVACGVVGAAKAD